jgi:hypothetical protein
MSDYDPKCYSCRHMRWRSEPVTAAGEAVYSMFCVPLLQPCGQARAEGGYCEAARLWGPNGGRL